MVKQGYKQTEIGLIPEDWEVKELGEVLLSNPDYGINAAAVDYDDTLPTYLRITDIDDNGRFIKDNLSSVDDLNSIKYFLNENELVFARTGASVGKTYLYKSEDGKLVFAGFLIRAKISSYKANSKFIFYNTQTKYYKNWIISNSMRSGQPGINSNEIKSLQIPLPPLAEQEAIAAALSDADAWIESLEQLIAKKRLIKQGAMQTLLTPKEDWIEYDFNKVVWFQEGPGLRNWQFTKDGIKVINVTNLENGYLNLAKTSRHISWNEFERMYKHFEIDEGDIVVASSGNSYGKVSVVRKQDLPLVMNTSVIRFKPSDTIGYKYLLVFLKSFLFKDQIDLLITGGAQPNFGPAHLNKIKISSPKSLSEQERIARILSDMDAELEALEQQLAKARQIKQGMMQELLTGRTRLV